MILALGGLLGFISVAFGAYTEHGLQSKVSEEVFRHLMTAIRYNQIHAVVLVAIGLAVLKLPELSNFNVLQYAGYGFALGTICFCFSIYASALFSNPGLTYLAPVGGILLMLSWLSLIYVGLKA